MNTLNGNFIERVIPNIKNATLNLLIGDQIATMNLADFQAAIAPSSKGLKMKDNLPLDGTLNNVVDSSDIVTISPLQLSTEAVGLLRTVNLSAGATTPRLFNVAYTINNSGVQTGALTGIFLNATETALNGITHNLLDLQVGGVSQMIVKNSGFVGIGTSTPSTFFEVLRTSNGEAMIRLGSTGNNQTGYQIFNNGALKWQMYNANSSNDLRFYDGDIRVVFKSGGDVGIGTVLGAVSARLHIKGSGTTSATTSLLVQNSASVVSLQITDNNLLCLGGTTSSFPAIKRNGAAIDFRLADDSGYCNLTASTVNGNGIVCLSAGGVGISQISNVTTYGFHMSRNFVVSWGSNTQLDGSLDTAIARYSANVVRISNASTGAGNLFIGASTGYNASAILQADSTTQGFLPPRMTTAQVNAIATPAEGLVVYNTTISYLCVYQAGVWVRINHSPM